MKTILTILFLIILLLIVIMTISKANSTKTENEKYTVLHKKNNFEIRQYSSSIYASVRMAGSYDQMSGNGFRVLAGYIFGGNEQNTKIAMTSPVKMEFEDSNTIMSFMMPSKYDLKDLPSPGDPRIWFEKSDPEIVASISFGGYANDKTIYDKIEELKVYLQKNNIQHNNDFAFLGYNPPYQFLGRRNEVVVSLINYENGTTK